MSAKGAVDALLAAFAAKDTAAALAATKGGKLDIVPLDIKGAASTKGKEYFGDLFNAFPDLEVQVVNTVIGGDKALLDVVLRGTPKDTYAGITARDGSALESRQAWRIDTADGVVSALRVYYCSNELKRSLGAAKTYEEAIAGERV